MGGFLVPASPALSTVPHKGQSSLGLSPLLRFSGRSRGPSRSLSTAWVSLSHLPSDCKGGEIVALDLALCV